MEGTRGSVSKTGSLSSRAFADSDMTSRNMETTSRGLCSCSLTRAQNKFCGLRRKFSRALEKGQCTGDRNEVSRETSDNKALSFLIRARTDNQIPPHVHANNAECAPESLPQGHGLVPCMFQLHVGDRAGLSPCSGSSCLNPFKRARMRNRFSIQARASPESMRSGRSVPI